MGYTNLALKEGVRSRIIISRIISLYLELKTMEWMKSTKERIYREKEVRIQSQGLGTPTSKDRAEKQPASRTKKQQLVRQEENQNYVLS